LRPVAAHPASPTPRAPKPEVTGVVADLDLAAMEADARRAIGEMAYAYFAGGAEAERLLDDNTAAWGRYRLHPRVLVDVSAVSTATTLLGTPVPSPVVLAPTALQALAHPDGECATARGAAAQGALMVLSSLATSSLEDVAAAAPGAPRWMQVYVLRDRDRTADMVARAAANGYRALVVTVDAPVPGLRLRELRGGVRLPDDLTLPNLAGAGTGAAHQGGFMAVVTQDLDPSLTERDLTWLAGLTDLPVVVKGVTRADDARRCVDAGAAAVIVSNHGARQLDDAPATADVLAEVARALAPGGAEVYVDGGVRRAGDVAKALCLGARAGLVGRPALWALSVGGADGVAGLLEWFAAELARTMALVGAPRVGELGADLVRAAPPAGAGDSRP
jgi:4-hydroxymandelate oxidase